MAYLQYIIVSLIFILLCVHNSSAIRCYECNSHNDTRCAMEKIPDDLKVTCPEKTKSGEHYILCRKIKQVIDFEVQGLSPNSRVIRGCGWDNSSHQNRCYQRSGFGGRQEVCACQEDFCNGSTTIALTSTSLLLVALNMLRNYL